MKQTTEVQQDDIESKIKHYNNQSFSDQASLRYLANTFDDIVFRTDAGLMDFSTEAPKEEEGLERVKISGFHRDDKVVVKIVRQKYNEFEKCFGSYQKSETLGSIEEAEEYIKDFLDLDSLEDLSEEKFNLDDYREGGE